MEKRRGSQETKKIVCRDKIFPLEEDGIWNVALRGIEQRR